MINALAINAGLGFVSGFLKGYRNTQAARQQASVYAYEAQAYRRNAARVYAAGALNEDILRSGQRATVSKGAAAAGEAGMGESPTTVAALATTYGALEQNILNQRYEMSSEAENYLYQARIADENQRQMKKKARHAFGSALISGISGGLGAYNSLLSK